MNSSGRILVIDDEEEIGLFIKKILEKKNLYVEYVITGAEAIKILRENFFDIILIDFRLPDMDGFEILTKLKEENLIENTSAILMTAYGDNEIGINAIEFGFNDYIAKPFNIENLLFRISKELENICLKKKISMLKQPLLVGFSDIIGNSKRMKQVYKIIKKVADKNATVLIEGETGTGKELVAKAIQKNSPRHDKIFIPINCGALTETLLESELFGHEKGAFTGASNLKYGILETANGGTVFLDEINNASLNVQNKLLRFIETGEFIRVGGTKVLFSDTRIIAATNKNLEELIKNNKFREDLFHRLNVVKITLPPLRKRKDDIPLLIQHFTEFYNKKFSKTVTISTKAIDYFMNYEWPGNVRQLRNLIHSIILLTDNEIIFPNELPDIITLNKITLPIEHKVGFKEMKRKVIENFEIDYVKRLLTKTKGNVSKAAKIAKLNRKNFIEKLKSYNINPAEFK